MIKDIVVNLGLGEHDPAGDFAIPAGYTEQEISMGHHH